MLLLTTLALLVTSASSHPAPADLQDPTLCCFPDQWEVYTQTTDHLMVGATIYSAYDKVNNLEATKIFHDLKLTNHYITDYNNMVAYSVDLHPTTCKKTSVALPYFNCLNDTSIKDLKYAQSHFDGPPSVENIVHGWTYTRAEQDYILAVKFLTGEGYKPQTCAPVIQTITGNNKVTVTFFADISTTIQDKDIFTIPEICKHN